MQAPTTAARRSGTAGDAIEPEGSSRTAVLLWPVAVCAVTALAGLLPVLASRTFYMRGDTGAQFAPTWYRLGQLIRDGHWPPVMDADAWVGGNFAGEALFGVYNPLNAVVWAAVSLAPELLVAVVATKVLVMVALALGLYLLVREYGGQRWAAAVVATAIPVSGFTLFWDAGSWVSGLMGFAYTPWVWWSFRRALRGTANPLWGFLIGALAILQGNPYGTLGVLVVGLALVAEGLRTRNGRGTLRLVLLGGCVAAFLPLVYLPLVETVALAYRADIPMFFNNGKLRPALGDLLHLSSPTFAPDIRAVTGDMRVPATYLAWFVVPLLPWLRYRWSVLTRREATGALVVVTLYFLLTVGPSQLWLFRWPLRHVEYLYLGLLVVFALLLSEGLAVDRWGRRAWASAALVVALGWLTWAEDPRWETAAFAGPAMLACLTAVLVLLLRRRSRSRSLLAAFLVAGSVAVLAGQLFVFRENASSRPWYFPSDVAALESRFEDRDGLVLQLADLKSLQQPGRRRELERAWQSYLAGSMYAVAKVDAVNSYSGMGLEQFTDRLCMSYEGFTRACGYRALWQPVGPAGEPLVDLMKVEMLVVQPQLLSGRIPPDGWTVEQSGSGPQPWVLVRDEELPWPESRLSALPQGAAVAGASSRSPYGETVQLAATGSGGGVVFATLGWPGYSATFDGRSTPVSRNEAGLLVAQVPAGEEGTLEVDYRPPGQRVGFAVAGVGSLLALLLAAVSFRARRRGARGAAAGA